MPKNVSSASRVTAPHLSPTPTGYIGLSVSRRRTPESFQRQQLSGRAPLRTRVGQRGCESLVQQVLSVARGYGIRGLLGDARRYFWAATGRQVCSKTTSNRRFRLDGRGRVWIHFRGEIFYGRHAPYRS